jgi:DNA-directed RNA polymerase subunit RPC12/RpoP
MKNVEVNQFKVARCICPKCLREMERTRQYWVCRKCNVKILVEE